MDLSTLRRRGESALRELAEAELQLNAGRAKSFDFSGFFARHSDLTSAEAWALARESADRASEAEDKARHRKLLWLSLLFQEGRASARSLEERFALEIDAPVRFDGEQLSLAQAARKLPLEAPRDRRARLARAADLVVPQFDGQLARWIGACQELASRLGMPSYESLWSLATGIDLAELAAQAKAVLAETEDAYRDLLTFGMRKVVGPVGLKPRGEAARHDLVRFGRLKILDDLFPRRRLLPMAQSFLEQIGLSPDAGGHLQLDLEEKQGLRSSPTVAALEVPFDVRVFVPSSGGAAEFAAALEGLGRAQRLCAMHPDATFEDRRLGDRGLEQGFALVFGLLLADQGFLRKRLDAEPRDALEAARLIALRELIDLRRRCAALEFERALYREGPAAGLEGLARELFQKALLVEWPVERWLWDVEPMFASAFRLRGHALAAALHRALLEHGDEDYWRNPRTGALLKKWWGPGARGDAASLSKSLGAELSLSRAAARLIAVAAR
jgi:hypothetical protein